MQTDILLALTWLSIGYIPLRWPIGVVKIINNDINLDVFKLLPNKVKGRNLLFVGRFIYQKNPIFLIEVFAEYCKLYDDASLTCVGGMV